MSAWLTSLPSRSRPAVHIDETQWKLTYSFSYDKQFQESIAGFKVLFERVQLSLVYSIVDSLRVHWGM